MVDLERMSICSFDHQDLSLTLYIVRRRMLRIFHMYDNDLVLDLYMMET